MNLSKDSGLLNAITRRWPNFLSSVMTKLVINLQ